MNRPVGVIILDDNFDQPSTGHKLKPFTILMDNQVINAILCYLFWNLWKIAAKKQLSFVGVLLHKMETIKQRQGRNDYLGGIKLLRIWIKTQSKTWFLVYTSLWFPWNRRRQTRGFTQCRYWVTDILKFSLAKIKIEKMLVIRFFFPSRIKFQLSSHFKFYELKLWAHFSEYKPNIWYIAHKALGHSSVVAY